MNHNLLSFVLPAIFAPVIEDENYIVTLMRKEGPKFQYVLNQQDSLELQILE